MASQIDSTALDLSNSITLCLSGGGKRATLFHLGLIKAMRQHYRDGQSALSNLREIYSVSGGSITAAHLVGHWKAYNGSPADYKRAEQELIRFCRRNVRDRVVRRWFLTRWLGRRRSYWLQREYAWLLGGKGIAHCYGGEDRPPEVHILSTSFAAGELCSFSHDKFEIVRRENGKTRPVSCDAGHIPMAYAVAASSAFPPLFPPVPLTLKQLGVAEGGDFADDYLSDGGVFDNLGLERVRLLGVGEDRPGQLIVSNAGASFRTEPGNSFGNMFARNIRASDILMRRVGDSTEDGSKDFAVPGSRVSYISARIGEVVTGSRLTEETQKSMRLVRTDLDRFSSELANLLVDHGYEVGAKLLTERGWVRKGDPDWLSGGIAGPAAEQVAVKAAGRNLVSLVSDFRDWTTGVILALGAVVLAFGFVVTSRAIEERKAEAARQEAEAAERNAQKTSAALADLLVPIRDAQRTGDPRKLEVAIATALKSAEIIEQNPGDAAPAPVSVTGVEATRIIEAETVSPTLTTTRWTQPVYIQFAGVITRDQIRGLNQSLKAAGWQVEGPSGERIRTAAGLNIVKYSEGNQQAAEDLASAITASGIAGGQVKAVRVDAVGPNLEVWISN